MSTIGTAFDYGTPVAADDRRHLPLGPSEGWSSVLLLVLMAALVGWAIDDARWVLGSQSLTNFLPWAGALGVLWGVVAAKSGRGRLLAYLGGAAVATAYLTLVVGDQLAPGASVGGLFQATSNSVVEAWLDLVVRNRATTTEIGHFLMVLGIICWAAGQFAGYTAFAHRRPVAAVLLPGSILLANVVLTFRDQYPLLVVYSPGRPPLPRAIPRGGRAASLDAAPDRRRGRCGRALDAGRPHLCRDRRVRCAPAHPVCLVGTAGGCLAGPQRAVHGARPAVRPLLPGRRAWDADHGDAVLRLGDGDRCVGHRRNADPLDPDAGRQPTHQVAGRGLRPARREHLELEPIR